MTDNNRDCSNCANHPEDAKSLDDCPGICWNCVAAKKYGKLDYYPCWTPKEEDESNNR